MRKALTLALISLVLLINLATLCLADKKMESLENLIKNAPFFGHVFDTKKFTYIGIYYPSFVYDKKANELTIWFSKIDKKSVRYRFKIDCPPILPLKNQIQVKEKVFKVNQPENYIWVDTDTIYTFAGRVDKKINFDPSGKKIKKWARSDWSLQMSKPEDISFEPNEKGGLIDKIIKEFYPSISEIYLEEAKEIIEGEIKSGKDVINQILETAALYSLPPPTEIIEPPFPKIPSPDHYSIKIDPSFILSLKKEIIIKRAIPNIIANLPFLPEPRKFYFYGYLPTRDLSGVFGNKVFFQLVWYY